MGLQPSHPDEAQTFITFIRIKLKYYIKDNYDTFYVYKNQINVFIQGNQGENILI